MPWRCACASDEAGVVYVAAQRSTRKSKHAVPSWCCDGQLGAAPARGATFLLPHCAVRAWLPVALTAADCLHAVQRAKQEGATLLTGGKRPSHLKKGYFGEGAVLECMPLCKLLQQNAVNTVNAHVPCSLFAC